MTRRAIRNLLLAVALGSLAVTVLPLPALGRGAPETLASARALGTLRGAAPVVAVEFPIDYVGVSWTSGEEPYVRFRAGGRWGPWIETEEEDLPVTNGRYFSGLEWADKADAYQVRGRNASVRSVAINTTDGPRPITWDLPGASASHIDQPPVISRSEWGANEGLRFRADGSEKWRQTFHPTQKLIVHHTVTRNNDPDPAATVRAIYRYHAIDRGWGDIGYNFLMDEQGRIYKGRYSGPLGTRHRDTQSGHNGLGHGVTGAHTGGYNSGTMGLAVLGNYDNRGLTTASRDALVEHLAWESEDHGLDPEGSSTYVNPVTGERRQSNNISGHRDWRATACPGAVFYSQLAEIRRDVAERVGSGPVDPELVQRGPCAGYPKGSEQPNPDDPTGQIIVGTDGDDVLIGTDGDDVICGLRGDDEIRGLGGDDLLVGGPGRDTIFGGPGDDRIRGGSGRDRLYGGPGDDVLRGGRGHDVLRGGRGHDRLFGGRGNDRLFGGRGFDRCFGGPGTNTYRGCQQIQ